MPAAMNREHDIENIQRAHDLVQAVEDWIRETPGWPELVFDQPYDCWSFSLNHVGNSWLKNLTLVLTKKDNPFFRWSHFGFTDSTMNHQMILLKILDHRGIHNPYLGTWLGVLHRSIFEHEMVHYLDFRRGAVGDRNEKVGSGPVDLESFMSVEKWSQYSNHPFELNARWQEAATILVASSLNFDFVREALKDYFRFRNVLWGRMDRDFVEALTIDNKQRLEKRTWQLFQNLRATDRATVDSSR